MSILFLEAFSGLSGDMLNGLLVDLGADVDYLQRELAKLSMADEFHLHIQKIAKSNIYGIDFDVHLSHDHEKDNGIALEQNHHSHEHHEHTHHHSHVHHHEHEHAHHHNHTHTHAHHHDDEIRTMATIRTLIEQSAMTDFVKQKSIAVFEDIARAEAKVHNIDVAEVHFHEVGAIDSIVDILSFFILWETLSIQKVYCTPITEGSGTIKVAHGVMPVPVPAVMQLRVGANIPIVQDFEIKTELITPTGLSLLKALQPIFMTPSYTAFERVGYGFGKRDTGKFNALRGTLINDEVSHSQTSVVQQDDTIYQIEATIDDQTPEQLGYLLNFMLEQGALDIYYQSIYMKKNRPGILLTLLIEQTQLALFTQLLFKETSTIGFRYQLVQRKVMTRTFAKHQTSLGNVRVKQNQYDSIVKQTLEYEDCVRIAKEKSLPLQVVYQQLIKELNL